MFGFLPDILMGKDPKKALLENVASVAATAVGAPMMDGLLSGAPASPEGFTNGGFLGEGVQSGVPQWDGAGSNGLLNGFKTASGYMKPVGEAMGAAKSAQGLLGQQSQGVQGSPVATGQGGAQGLAGLYGQIQQSDMQRQQDEMQKRMKRQQLLGGA